MIDVLIQRIKDKKSISDDPMLDGFMIGLMYSNSKYIANVLLTDDTLPPLTDNAIQQVEQVLIWLLNNEKILIDLF